MTAHVKIECPCCGWEPDGGAHWMCTCGWVWNTFDTAGRCPNCGKQWERTACIPYMGGCHAMPLHVDWYKGLDDWLEDELNAVKKNVPAVAQQEKAI